MIGRCAPEILVITDLFRMMPGLFNGSGARVGEGFDMRFYMIFMRLCYQYSASLYKQKPIKILN